MIKTTMKFLTAFALALALIPSNADAQGTRLTMTTPSVAITQTATTVTLTSSIGVTAAGSQGQYTTMLYIDRELFGVQSLVSGTTWKVARGVQSTRPLPHTTAATVFIGPPSGNFISTPITSEVFGACTYSNSVTLPFIYLQSGNIYDCIGGQWTRGIRTPTTAKNLQFPPTGGTVYTSINTTGTAVGATTLYCTEVNIPYSKFVTGLGVLNGTTVTGNARYVVLYDSAGRALANSALIGQASVTASIYENYAFTTPYYVVGPAQYFGCLQDNAVGSTTVRMAVTQVNDTVLTKGQTGATFGTVPALTVPTTFTTAVGPYLTVY